MSMRLAYRSRPGIAGPSRKAAIIAACLAAAAGFYGFATSMQKAATLRTAAGAGSAIEDNTRVASPAAPTPSLVYAVTETGPTETAAAPAPVAVAAAEAAADAAEDVSLVSQPLTGEAVAASATTTEAPAAPLEVATAGPLTVPPPVVPAPTPVVVPPVEPAAGSTPTP